MMTPRGLAEVTGVPFFSGFKPVSRFSPSVEVKMQKPTILAIVLVPSRL